MLSSTAGDIHLNYGEVVKLYVHFAGEVHIFRQDWNFDVQCYAVPQVFRWWHQIRVSRQLLCLIIVEFSFQHRCVL